MTESALAAPLLSVASELAPGTLVRASGSRFELGVQIGTAQRGAIHRFLGRRLAGLEVLAAHVGDVQALRREIGRHMRVIERSLPGMAQELNGLAHGAEISVSDAYLLQLRRELTGYQSVRPAAGDCTTFGRLGGTSTVLGQTIDLNGDLHAELCVLDLTHAASGRRLLMASFTGLLGYLGMNDRGLAIGLNLVLGGDWQPGIPGYMAIRHLLDECASVDECIALLRQLPLASSRALMITDGRRLVVVEYILNSVRVTEHKTSCVHANHFLHPDFHSRDELNPFARTSSLRREQACTTALRSLGTDATASACFAFLQTPPLHVEGNGDMRRECTVGAVVMHPLLGRFAIRQRAATSQPARGAPSTLSSV
ncbi:C45 family peptidase [Variovorax sp. ZS18.2.2]|uniref:C45 family autoproteolytic acyltransferase/hydolase n=1 Tax=Variovorax sp. ZS18.2.2 TaxID=2971255 RepID=UPI002150DF88|nr:C45 family peptidase [Variovorax sp. ZS18.2.2]MCR6480868.1 C45 family peptidase [Variovorax sp. ZS18.2.2]